MPDDFVARVFAVMASAQQHTFQILTQCQTAHVDFFFKQVGGRTSKAGGRLLDGRTWDEFPRPQAKAGVADW